MRMAQGCVLIWLLLTCASADAAPLYTVTDLGQFWVQGLNNDGQVVGTYGVRNNWGNYAYLYNSYGPQAGTLQGIRGTFSSGVPITDIGQAADPGGIFNFFNAGPVPFNGNETAINQSGQVAGWNWVNPSGLSTDPITAALWSNGQTTNLGALPGATYSKAEGLNNVGQVVGWSYLDPVYQNNPIHHAVLWSHGQITDLGTMGGVASEAIGINDAGQIVGFATFASGSSHAFLYQNGSMTDLGKFLLPSTNSWASAINASGEVTGVYFDPTTNQAGAFLYDHGKFLKLEDALPPGAGWHNLSPIAINDLGQTIAAATDPNNQRGNLLLTPTGLPTPAPLITPDPVVPEPSTLICFGAALAMLGVRRAVRGK